MQDIQRCSGTSGSTTYKEGHQAASWNLLEDLAERGGGRSLESRRREQICKEEILLREEIFSLLSAHRKGNREVRDALKLP